TPGPAGFPLLRGPLTCSLTARRGRGCAEDMAHVASHGDGDLHGDVDGHLRVSLPGLRAVRGAPADGDGRGGHRLPGVRLSRPPPLGVFTAPGLGRSPRALPAARAREERSQEAPEVVTRVTPERPEHPALSRLPRP